MIDNSSGTTIVNFGLKAMREYKIILPPIELQNKFANFVQQIDKSKLIVQKQLKLLEELLESKMNIYFDTL